MRSIEEVLSPRRGSGFGGTPQDINVLGFDIYDLAGVGTGYGLVAAAILVWAPVAVVVVFALLSGMGFGIVFTLAAVIYMENNPPKDRWVGTPYA